MQRFARSIFGRTLAILEILAMNLFACGSSYPSPDPGFADYQRLGFIHVPGGVFNAPGVNFMHERIDIEVDTAVWAQSVGAIFNSANDQWQWSYAVEFDGSIFIDASGMRHDVAAVPDGNAIPGTHWVRVDATTIKTKGGRVYHFDALGRIDFLSWANTDYPQIKYVWQADQLQTRLCMSAIPLDSCALIHTIALGSYGPTSVIDERSAQVGVTRMASYAYDTSRPPTLPVSVTAHAPGLPYRPTTDTCCPLKRSWSRAGWTSWISAPSTRTVTSVRTGDATWS